MSPITTQSSALCTPSLQAAATIQPHASSSSNPPSSTLVSTALEFAPEATNAQPVDYVVLPTAILYAKSHSGVFIPCRALLDSGSQLNFITARLVKQLQLKTHHAAVSISGIGESTLSSNMSTDISAQSRDRSFSTSFSAVVTRTITDYQPHFGLDISGWNIPKNISLADPTFFKSQRIDLLLGAGLFFDLICIGQIRMADNLPTLQKTKLGWIASGGLSRVHNKHTSLSALYKEPNPWEDPLSDIVKRFWEVDNCCGTTPALSDEDALCEQLFLQGYTRLKSGQYSVRLPAKLSFDTLGDSYQRALRRFKSLENKLDKNHQLKESYSAFMREYIDLGHMSLASKQQLVPQFYLPHHCVEKPDSSTTKLRVVFDGSAKSTSGASLNDLLHTGPAIQPKLFNILIQFRFLKVAMCGDICKMYRCVRITHPDQFLQCILWRDHQNESIRTYTLDTVTYGTKPAAFLAIRAMQQLAHDEEPTFPLAAKIVCRDFYVDDLISGGDSIEEAIQIRQQVKLLLAKGHFPIRKWCSNEPDALKGESESDCEKLMEFKDGTNIAKTLGLAWSPSSDSLLFNFAEIVPEGPVTKRSILSMIARFYDPLGLIAPIVTRLKVFLQALWKERVNWDECLSQSLHFEWIKLISQLSFVSSLKFSRFVLMPLATYELHGFCDASTAAYGACVFVRSEMQGVFSSHLLCSKSRVAPLKTLTIPKLELAAALLLSELIGNIAKCIQFECRYHCWTDSTVALAWIRESPSKFNVFVSNRVSQIQERTKGMTWHHVPSQLNPADILSRGCTPLELLDSQLWHNGPPFIQAASSTWPQNVAYPFELPERRQKVLVLSTKTDLSASCKFNNTFAKLQRTFAYVYRFIALKRSDSTSSKGPLTPDDIKCGTHLLIKNIQLTHFAEEYKALSLKRPLPTRSKLRSLCPLLDAEGLLRIGGRLQNSNLEYEAKHPLLLPKRHPVTAAMITYYHLEFLHAGPQFLLATLRQRYWPIGGLKAVSNIINRCVRCFRMRPKLLEQVMAPLPAERVQPSPTFHVTGIDFCGPFYVKSEKTRMTWRYSRLGTSSGAKPMPLSTSQT
ncbi:uncharacterized protein LOC135438811 isoform X1 [Drosophila montana]|uniref:uncharacterized protein LOC135438811 isoform X1 n=1 Tax=Drosophila montana TaxID=40370 RepID=UPI00313DBCD5